MAEDPALTAAEVSRIVGAPPSWTRKALRLLELPEAIVARVERGDLSFTAADFVRRGIAKGDVSAEDGRGARRAARQRRADRRRAQVRRRLRPAAARELRRGLRAPGRRAPRPPAQAAARGARRLRAAAPASPPSAPRATTARRDAQVDGFVLGEFLHHSATERTRKLLRITGQADAHEYARSLHPHERLLALRSFAREVIEEG